MWKELPADRKKGYRELVETFTSLTKLFTQKAKEDEVPAPYINSKFQEMAFCYAFGALEEDIGNTSFDASLKITYSGTEHRYLIGIKTFGLDAGLQKIAQMKKISSEWHDILRSITHDAKGHTANEINAICHERYMKLAVRLSEIRNERIDSSISLLKGFRVNDDIVESVYHVLMPSVDDGRPAVTVGEMDYSHIDIDSIRIIGCTNPSHPTNFNFTDGKHTYRFTSADSQLLMDFRNREITLEKWYVTYLDDPISALLSLRQNAKDEAEATTAKEQIHLPEIHTVKVTESYSWFIADDGGEVPRYSGFNGFYGLGSKLGQVQREGLRDKIHRETDSLIESPADIDPLIDSILRFILWKPVDSDERRRKEEFRKKIMESVSDSPVFMAIASKYLFRPMSEMYIPIGHSKEFHTAHPDFFAPSAGLLKSDGKTLALPKEERAFTLCFEPSGNRIRSFITQDTGKGIESTEKQSYLGDWILRDVFRLQNYEPLSERKLDEIGINAFRLYRTNADDMVHIEFTQLDPISPPDDIIC